METLSSTASVWYPTAGSGERTLSRLWHNTCMHTHIHTPHYLIHVQNLNHNQESKPQPGSSSTVHWQLDPVRSLNRQSLSPQHTHKHIHTPHYLSISSSTKRVYIVHWQLDPVRSLNRQSLSPHTHTHKHTHTNVHHTQCHSVTSLHPECAYC